MSKKLPTNIIIYLSRSRSNELEKCQKQVYEFNHNSRPFQAKYMLSGLGRCGYCDTPLETVLRSVSKTVIPKEIYQCKNCHPRIPLWVTVFNDNKKCDSGYYPMEDIENAVIAQISILQSDEKALKSLINENAELMTDASAFKKQLKNIESKIKKMSDLYFNDFITLEELKEKTEKLQGDKFGLCYHRGY